MVCEALCGALTATSDDDMSVQGFRMLGPLQKCLLWGDGRTDWG